MYFPSHAIQQQIVLNRVKLQPKSHTEELNPEDIAGNFLTIIGNMHDYLVGGTDEDFPSHKQVKLWFTYVVYSGILKLDLPIFTYHLNIGVDLKTFYQDSLMPVIRHKKTLKFKAKENLNLKAIDLSEVNYYPNIYAAAFYFAQRYLDQPLIVLHLSKASFEGIHYKPGQPFTKQAYVIGSGFESLDLQKQGKNDVQKQGKYLQQLVKKAAKLNSLDENAPVYILVDPDIEDSILKNFQEKFIKKRLIFLNELPSQITSLGLFLIHDEGIISENTPTVGIAFSKSQTFFTGPTKKSADTLLKTL